MGVICVSVEHSVVAPPQHTHQIMPWWSQYSSVLFCVSFFSLLCLLYPIDLCVFYYFPCDFSFSKQYPVLFCSLPKYIFLLSYFLRL